MSLTIQNGYQVAQHMGLDITMAEFASMVATYGNNIRETINELVRRNDQHAEDYGNFLIREGRQSAQADTDEALTRSRRNQREHRNHEVSDDHMMAAAEVAENVHAENGTFLNLP